MDNEKLIELVRGYSFLYDLSDRRYSDTQRKDDAWKEVSRKLQVPEKDCKKTWSLLRDAFRRAIKKQNETKSGQAGGSTRKWKYQDEMSFLLPYFKERPTLCSIPTNREDQRSDTEVNDSSDDNEDHLASSDTNTAPTTLSEQTNISEATVSQPGTSKNKHSTSKMSQNYTPHIKRAKISQQKTPQYTSETPSTSLMKFILENKTKSNDVQQFFDSIATTVQSFPLRDRAIAKAKVFPVISEMELEILGRDSRPSTSTTDYASSPAYCLTPPQSSPNEFYTIPRQLTSSSKFTQGNNMSGPQGYNNIQETETSAPDYILQDLL